MRKLFNRTLVLLALILGVYAYSIISNIPHQNDQAYAYMIDPTTGEVVEVKQEEQPSLVAKDPTFARGHTTQTGVSWRDMPCRNNRTGAYYESDILSFAEIEWNLIKVGFTPTNAHTMAAIAHKESGHQLNCFGDESLINSKWTDSYGIFQIRGLVAENGKGTCRDITALVNNIEKQSQCAYEISGGGTNFRPWSMYLNGKYRKSL